MKIGFDAKRAFHNGTGLGHYSRTLITSLAKYHPDNSYLLFNPKASEQYADRPENVYEILPQRLLDKKLSSIWRSKWMIKDLKAQNLSIFHGLSHELPLGINRAGIPAVVTMHDLIFERFPWQYSMIDVKVYSKKFKYACNIADKIIAISLQTKQDLIDIYGVKESKITVCYQSCSEAFATRLPIGALEAIRQKYQLPERYFLYVGSIIERKNLLNICKALLINQKSNIPLVVIGDGKKYKTIVKDFISRYGLGERVIFLSETEAAKKSIGYRNAADFPAIYQMAAAMIYPSFFEGFGIPVLEALWSRLPVITSNVSCMPEVGGPTALYVSPDSPEEIAHAMQVIEEKPLIAAQMQQDGSEHAMNFTAKDCAGAVYKIYNSYAKL